jgi:hypothetical protein
MRRLILFLFFACSAFGQVTWTRVWPPVNDGSHNPANGYEDVVWDAYSNKLWLYTTNGSNSGDQIYSIRLHYFDPVAVSDTNIGDNGQTQAGGCFASTSTWPASHHTVGQFWVDAVRHRVYTTQGVACAERMLEQWYYQLLSPISGTSWTQTFPKAFVTTFTGETGPFSASNYPTTTLSALIGSGDSTMNVTSASYAINQDFYKIDSEVVRITSGGNPTVTSSTGSGSNPLSISRGQYGTSAAAHSNGATVARLNGQFDNGRVVHDIYDDAFFWFGNRNDNSYGQLQVYCDTSGTNTLTSAQTSVGCLRADDWTDLTAKSICAGTGCTASAETGTNGANSGKVPSGWYYPSLDYDSTTHTLLDWGGSHGAAPGGNQTTAYRYTPTTFTWAQLTTTCSGADCSGTAPALYSTNVEHARVAHAVYNGKYYYHFTSPSANSQDWVLDPGAGTWTEIQTNAGPSKTETMTIDPATGKLYSWANPVSGSDGEIWVGQLSVSAPVISTTSPLTTGNQYAAYSVSLAASNSPTSWAITSGSLPTGLAFNASTGAITGTTALGGSWSITVTATNGGGTSSPVVFSLPITATPGLGASTYNCVDADGDGYGVGPGCTGPDADDTDATVHSASDVLAKWTTLAAFWSHMGWTPTNVLYVDGGSGSCTGITTPFVYDVTKGCTTIAGAITAQSAGDAVVMRAGTYAQGAVSLNMKTGTLSGTSCATYTYYLAYPGEAIEVTFASGSMSWSSGSAAQSCFFVDGIKWTQNSHGLGKGFGASLAVPMYGWNITHNEVSGFTDNVFPQFNIHGALIAHNYLHDAYQGGDFGHNIYLGSNCPGFAGCGTESTGTTIIGNIIANADDTCIHMNGPMTNITVDSNLVYGCSKGLSIQSGIAHSTIQNNVVHTNARYLLTLNDYASSYSSQQWQCNDENYNAIRNNTFFEDAQSFDLTRNSIDAGSTAIYVADDNSGGGCNTAIGHVPDMGHNTYDNNVFVHSCATNCYSTGSVNPLYAGPIVRYASSVDSGASAATWISTDIWRNNVLKNFDVNTRIIDPGTATNQNCAWFTANVPGSGNVCDSDPTFTAANPLWSTAPSSWNLNVQSGSPAISTGLGADTPTFDVVGITRGGSPWIGAYQSIGTPPVTTIGPWRSGKVLVGGGISK